MTRGLDNLRPIDNRDDRREIFACLQKLDDAQRIQFLQWAARQASSRLRDNGSSVRVIVSSTTGEIAETYLDLMSLATHHGLPWDVILGELERRASKKQLWMP